MAELGRFSASLAHQASQLNSRATSATTRVPATSPRRSSNAPSSSASRQTAESVPACGIRAEWNFSEPCSDARHWKKQTESAPRATCCSESRVIWPGALARLCGCQFTDPVECSISIHGSPPASPRVRSAAKASSDTRVVEAVVQVVVVGDDVDVGRPRPVVQVADVRGDHEVGGDRRCAVAPDDVELGAVVVEQLVGAEPREVEHLTGIGGRQREPRSADLAPVGVALAPEAGAPGAVQRGRSFRTASAASCGTRPR